MPKKITVVLVEQFTRNGDFYRRYQRTDTGERTDVKLRHRNGLVIWTAEQAEAQARRRLTGPWPHRHLVR